MMVHSIWSPHYPHCRWHVDRPAPLSPCSYMRQATKRYLGLDETDGDRSRARWQGRRRRLACRAYGRLKPECSQVSRR